MSYAAFGSDSRVLQTCPTPADMPGMERRRDPRLPTDMPAVISRLDIEEPARTVTVVNVSTLGVAVASAVEIPVHSPVRLDWSDGLLLGEVVHVRPDASGFILGLCIRHSLNDLAGIEASSATFCR